mmetsp:Transcript_11170/g.41705  ORF Transcript_11170/g.41705 Transcript_11170/m.41705 type:complete len:204 (+) Transcript_11170:106-717(+)|eukprot:scaffold1806_cov240-Pinguiococcus_pyrenoidosus.AAC.33
MKRAHSGDPQAPAQQPYHLPPGAAFAEMAPGALYNPNPHANPLPSAFRSRPRHPQAGWDRRGRGRGRGQRGRRMRGGRPQGHRGGFRRTSGRDGNSGDESAFFKPSFLEDPWEPLLRRLQQQREGRSQAAAAPPQRPSQDHRTHRTQPTPSRIVLLQSVDEECAETKRGDHDSRALLGAAADDDAAEVADAELFEPDEAEIDV